LKKKWEMMTKHVEEAWGTSKVDRYELTSIEGLLDTHNTIWVEG
jgi:hypothetical protein